MKPKNNKSIKVRLDIWIESLAQHFETPIIITLRVDKQGIKFEGLEAVKQDHAFDGWGDPDDDDEHFEPMQGHKLKSPINDMAR